MSTNIYNSPLRYPGGKSSLFGFISDIIILNPGIKTYIEPFAGGAGAALNLLYSGIVNRIVLNDSDLLIYRFWKSVLNDTDELIKRISDTPITVDEWEKNHKIMMDTSNHGSLTDVDIGFTVLFLNRCNFSGIIKAGPIGGKKQKSKWKIDTRFNKLTTIKKINNVAKHSSNIHLSNLDATGFLQSYFKNKKRTSIDSYFVYMDPPYYEKGGSLYANSFKKDDHLHFSKFLKGELSYKWLLSYDDTLEINNLYHANRKNGVKTNHFAQKAKIGKELIIASDNCILPDYLSNDKWWNKLTRGQQSAYMKIHPKSNKRIIFNSKYVNLS